MVDGACELELNRRRGFDYPLQAPEAAIPPEEDGVSIDAALAMRLAFLNDGWAEAGAVVPRFDALVELLPGKGLKQ